MERAGVFQGQRNIVVCFITLKYYAPKNLCWALLLLSQFNMTEENQLSFLYLEGCLRWAQKGHVGLDYDRPF